MQLSEKRNEVSCEVHCWSVRAFVIFNLTRRRRRRCLRLPDRKSIYFRKQMRATTVLAFRLGGGGSRSVGLLSIVIVCVRSGLVRRASKAEIAF